MRKASKTPIGAHASVRIFDKNRIEVDGGHLGYFLANNACSESIRAPNLQHAFAATQHFRDEFVSCEGKYKALRIVIPRLTSHEPEAFEPFFFVFFKNSLILWLTGFFTHMGLNFEIQSLISKGLSGSACSLRRSAFRRWRRLFDPACSDR